LCAKVVTKHLGTLVVVKEFSQHYLYNATTVKQGYNKGVVERYFNKLPDPLGSMIFEEYKKKLKEQ
jgi:hypothetical protein